MIKRKTAKDYDKAEFARYCKGRGRKAEGLVKEAYDAQDVETSVKDLLADILHLCANEGFDFNEIYNSAYYHFQAERIGGEHG